MTPDDTRRRPKKIYRWMLLISTCGLLSCLPGSLDPILLRLVIQASAFGEPLRCDREVATPLGGLKVSSLAFYLSHPRVSLNDLGPWSVRLLPNATQQEELALLGEAHAALECDGNGFVMQAHGTAALRDDAATAFTSASPGARVAFEIGVPTPVNHANPALAQPPLTVGAMHWSWLTGYKFLRFEAHLGDEPLLFHLGSTGCTGTPAEARCDYLNQTPISVEASVVALEETVDLYVAWDLSELVLHLAQPAVEGRDRRCQSDPRDPDCDGLLMAVGTGGSLPNVLQDSFRAGRPPAGVER